MHARKSKMSLNTPLWIIANGRRMKRGRKGVREGEGRKELDCKTASRWG
jgi:hypothetical protein